MQEQSDAEIEKSIRSFERQIARHEGWLDHPRTKAPDFDAFHPQRKTVLLDGWRQDIARHSECLDILRDVLKERKNGQA